jgi:hypothetical protein
MALRVEQEALSVALIQCALGVLLATPFVSDQLFFDRVGLLRLKKHLAIRGLFVRYHEPRRDVLDVLCRRAPEEPIRWRRASVGPEAQSDRAHVALTKRFELGIR